MSRSDLIDAIRVGNLPQVQANFQQEYLELDNFIGTTLLTFAVEKGTLEIVRFLVEQGADLEKRSGAFNSPALIYAAYKGNLDVVRYLVEAGAKLDISHPSRNPLRRAAGKGHLDVVDYLLTVGIDPHATYLLPTGALVNAFSDAENGRHNNVVELLRTYGCRRPIKGVDVPLWEPELDRRMDLRPEYQKYRQIIEYMEERYGPADSDGMQELLPQFEGMSISINVIQLNIDNPYLVLFTNGMSDRPMNVPPGLQDWEFAEIVLLLPLDWVHPREAKGNPEWMWPVNLLRQLAYHPHQTKTWFGRPLAIVANGNPAEALGPNTKQTGVLLLLDVLDLKPPLERPDGKRIHFFVASPLYAEEQEFERKHGSKAFLQRLFDREVSLEVDLNRKMFV